MVETAENKAPKLTRLDERGLEEWAIRFVRATQQALKDNTLLVSVGHCAPGNHYVIDGEKVSMKEAHERFPSPFMGLQVRFLIKEHFDANNPCGHCYYPS